MINFTVGMIKTINILMLLMIYVLDDDDIEELYLSKEKDDYER